MDPLPFNLSFSPNDLLGGATATGTITIGAADPNSSITFALGADQAGLVSFTPTSVVIPAGSTTGTFTLGTTAVPNPTVVNITAAWTDGISTASVTTPVTLEPVGLLSVTFTPSTVKQTGRTSCLIQFSGPLLSDTLVTIHQSPQLLQMAGMYTVKAGQDHLLIPSIGTYRVPRTLLDTVTVTCSAGTATGSVVVTR